MSTEVGNKMDAYGFERPEDIDNSLYDEFLSNYLTILNRRGRRWKPVMKDGHPSKGSKVKRFIRKGIPLEHRAKVWMMMSGANHHLEENPGVYASLKDKKPERSLLDVITADIPRTYPENIFFRNSEEPRSKMKSLGNILCAFAVHNPTVGYCQGLNYVAAVLLVIEEDEERTFWLLNTLVNDILPGYYMPDMLPVQVDCRVLEELLKGKCPAVYHRLQKLGTSCALLCTKWFICLFADVLPVETVMRIFDCLFYEGDKILYRASLTIIQMNEDKILACERFPDMVTTFRDMVHSKSALYCHEFALNMFKLPGSLSKSKIARLRKKFTQELQRTSTDENGIE